MKRDDNSATFLGRLLMRVISEYPEAQIRFYIQDGRFGSVFVFDVRLNVRMPDGKEHGFGAGISAGFDPARGSASDQADRYADTIVASIDHWLVTKGGEVLS